MTLPYYMINIFDWVQGSVVKFLMRLFVFINKVNFNLSFCVNFILICLYSNFSKLHFRLYPWIEIFVISNKVVFACTKYYLTACPHTMYWLLATSPFLNGLKFLIWLSLRRCLILCLIAYVRIANTQMTFLQILFQLLSAALLLLKLILIERLE